MSKIYDELEKAYAKEYGLVIIKKKTYLVKKRCIGILENGKQCKEILIRAKWVNNPRCKCCFYRKNKEFSKSYMANKRAEAKKKKK